MREPRQPGAEPTATPDPGAPPSPDAGADPAAGRKARRVRSLDVAAVVLASVASIALLRWATAFFVSFAAGVLIAYALRPPVEALIRLHLPRPLAASFVLLAVAAALGGGAYSLGDDFERAIATLPDAARKVRIALDRNRRDQTSPIAHVEQAAKELEKAASDSGRTAAAPARDAEAQGAIGTRLQQFLLRQTASALEALSEIGVALLLALLLLLAGDAFKRKLLHLVGPSLARRRVTMEVLRDIDVQVKRYMFVTMLTNLVVASSITALAFAVGLDQPVAWGITAGLLHFVPYGGAGLAALVLATGALLQFGSTATAALVGVATLVIVAMIGMGFQTFLQSRASRVNAVAVFVALMFFAWLWGPWGLVLGAPLLSIGKTIADRVSQPISTLLG